MLAMSLAVEIKSEQTGARQRLGTIGGDLNGAAGLNDRRALAKAVVGDDGAGLDKLLMMEWSVNDYW